MTNEARGVNRGPLLFLLTGRGVRSASACPEWVPSPAECYIPMCRAVDTLMTCASVPPYRGGSYRYEHDRERLGALYHVR